jgi:hypothetical protein
MSTTTTTTTTSEQTQAGTYTLDPVHSTFGQGFKRHDRS